MGAKLFALATTGDDTARSAVFDILRHKHWPKPYDFRAIRNSLHKQWEQRVEELRASPEVARADYEAGVATGDFTRAHATVGEAVGLLHDLPPAGDVIRRMTDDATEILKKLADRL